MGVAPDFAREIAANSPPAFRLAKHALSTFEEMSLHDGYRIKQNKNHDVGKTEGTAEAAQAFLEKREPNFRGQ